MVFATKTAFAEPFLEGELGATGCREPVHRSAPAGPRGENAKARGGPKHQS